MDKLAWRRRLRGARTDATATRDGGPGGSHGAAIDALARFLADAVPAGLVTVIYDALPDEVPLDRLVQAAADPEQRFALTRTPDAGHELTVHPYGAPTERHRYGYRQARADAPTVADGDIGAVLVPGLCFDRNGDRLGRGAGYYDRFLARLEPSVLRIGITAEMVVERLPTDGHDVAMSHLVFGGAVVEVPLAGPLPAGPVSSW